MSSACRICALSFCVAVAFTLQFAGNEIAVATEPELAGVVGGACYKAVQDDDNCGTENQSTCVDNQNGTYYKKVGTAQGEISCGHAAEGSQGRGGCTADTPKTCFTTYTCSDPACTSCGSSSTTTSVNSNATLSGSECTGSG
jgi:hypothetical protein